MCGSGNYTSKLGMVSVSYNMPLVYSRWLCSLLTLIILGWSWESLREWWQFLKLGLPGIAMICMEWVSYEIGAFVVGTISEVELAINAVIINVLTIAYMVSI